VAEGQGGDVAQLPGEFDRKRNQVILADGNDLTGPSVFILGDCRRKLIRLVS
jgi:hypothetical protein